MGLRIPHAVGPQAHSEGWTCGWAKGTEQETTSGSAAGRERHKTTAFMAGRHASASPEDAYDRKAPSTVAKQRIAPVPPQWAGATHLWCSGPSAQPRLALGPCAILLGSEKALFQPEPVAQAKEQEEEKNEVQYRLAGAENGEPIKARLYVSERFKLASKPTCGSSSDGTERVMVPRNGKLFLSE